MSLHREHSKEQLRLDQIVVTLSWKEEGGDNRSEEDKGDFEGEEEDSDGEEEDSDGEEL